MKTIRILVLIACLCPVVAWAFSGSSDNYQLDYCIEGIGVAAGTTANYELRSNLLFQPVGLYETSNYKLHLGPYSISLGPGIDTDADSVTDTSDNCPNIPNGPLLGTCVTQKGLVFVGVGQTLTTCTNNGDCGVNSCQLSQVDSNGNGCGDACECYADIDGNGKVELPDLVKMKSEYLLTCPPSSCSADLDGDNKVNLTDLMIMKLQYLRAGCPC